MYISHKQNFISYNPSLTVLYKLPTTLSPGNSVRIYMETEINFIKFINQSTILRVAFEQKNKVWNKLKELHVRQIDLGTKQTATRLPITMTSLFKG